MAVLDHVWPTLWQTKHNSIIMGLLVDKYQKYNRRINLIIVLASSSSVGAWAIWKQFPLVWSFIIIASQIATIVKPYFPYTKYIREFNTKCIKLDATITELEILFARQQENNEKETKDLEKEYISLKRQVNKILEFSDELLFSTSKKMQRIADIRLKSYLETTYDVKI